MDGAVLAGGKSRRMGRPKPFVKLGERPLISWVLESLRPLCREVFIVANRTEPFGHLGCRVVQDRIPDRGPMGGIYTALSSTDESQVFVVGCDSPFLRPELVQYLLAQVKSYEIVVPQLSDGFHPLQAVYTRDCLSRMYDCLIAGRLGLIDFIQKSRVRIVPVQEIESLDPLRLSFFNINTPQDLATASAFLNGRKRAL